MSSSREPARRGHGRLSLAVAWLALLLVLGVGAMYVLVLPMQPLTADSPSVRLTLPPPSPEGGMDDRTEDPRGASGPATGGPGAEGSEPDLALSPRADTRPSEPDSAPIGMEGQDLDLAALGEDAAPAERRGDQSPGAASDQAIPPVPGSDIEAPSPLRDDSRPPREAGADRGVTDEGTRPAWQRYARSSTAPEDQPRIAVVLRGLGVSSAATEAAIDRLPGEVSLSFSPYARRAGEWAARARASGHEILVDLPMEPKGFPARDPGPRALMTGLPESRNLERLDWILSKVDGAVGVVGVMGSRFVDDADAAAPVLQALKDRGLLYLDNGILGESAVLDIARQIEMPHVVNDRKLDDGQVSRAAIEARLAEAERIAEQRGLAIVIANPYPVTIDLLAEWEDVLDERGFALVGIAGAVGRSHVTRAASLR